MRTTPRPDERGMALVLVMLITVAVAALAAGAIFLTSSSYLISKGHEREDDMRNAADAGIELGRSALNGNPALFPDSGYTTYQNAQPVLDASGNQIPGLTRSIYFGPTGSATGQYGIFGSVLSVISDQSGAVVVRRGELSQESFAKFAYYTNSEGSGICFGNGDQIFGPMHTNDNMCIYSSGVHFHSTVEVSGTITNAGYGTFDLGYIQHGAVIPLPTLAQLAKLATYATQGGMNFTAPSGGTSTQSRLRIEFVALDLDGDGRVTGPNEGFFKVYIANSSANAQFVSGDPLTSNVNTTMTCGDVHIRTSNGVTDTTFWTAYDHYNAKPAYPYPPTMTVPGGGTSEPTSSGSTNQHNAASYSLARTWSRCYLAGDDHLNLDTLGVAPYRYTNTFRATDGFGSWQQYTATPDPAVVAALKNPASKAVDTTLATRQLEAQYLWPLARVYNPNSKGVIYVNGRVVLSGVVTRQGDGGGERQRDHRRRPPVCHRPGIGPVPHGEHARLAVGRHHLHGRQRAQHAAEFLRRVQDLRLHLRRVPPGRAVDPQLLHGGELRQGPDVAGAVQRHGDRARLSLHHRRDHPGDARRGRHHGRDRLHQGVLLRPVRLPDAAAVLPDHGPVLPEPLLRDRPGELQRPELLRHPLAELVVREDPPAPAGVASSTAAPAAVRPGPGGRPGGRTVSGPAAPRAVPPRA